MKLTPTQQENAVSQGAALGLLLAGRDELRFDKVKLDLAFEGAWRSWQYNGQFPMVNNLIRKGLAGYLVLTRADENKHVAGLYWRRDGGSWVICTHDFEWSVEEEEDVAHALHIVGTEVPLDGWVSLAEDFLRRLDR